MCNQKDRNEAWLLRLRHKSPCSFHLTLLNHCPGESQLPCLEVLKQTYGDFRALRTRGLLLTASTNLPTMWVSQPTWKWTFQLHSSLEMTTASWGTSSHKHFAKLLSSFWSTDTVRDSKCLLLLQASKFWGDLLCNNRQLIQLFQYGEGERAQMPWLDGKRKRETGERFRR